MYLRNSWYVAAWSHDLTDRPATITIMDEPIVLFRKADGTVAALEDRCPHRHLPLSMGKVEGNAIRCGYHGMVMDGAGKCIEVPSQSFVPPTARIRSYPVAERYGWVWVWMGEADIADADRIPDFGLLTDPTKKAVGKTNHVRASYQLVTDNLMDLSHVGFVHTTTIGTFEAGAKGKVSCQRTENGVYAVRPVPDVPQPPLYVKAGQLPQGVNIDRWSNMSFIAPCFVIIHVGGAEAGTGALEGRYDHGFNLWVMNAMTPETATTTNYFWASVRAHAIDSEQVDALMFAGVSEAFEEDKRVLEAQQAVIDRRGDSWAVALKGDAASIECRRVLAQRIAAEQDRAAGEASPRIAAPVI